MRRPWRIWVAFPTAPLLGAAVSAATFTAAFSPNWSNFSRVFLLMCAIAEGATLVLAVPSYLLLRRLGQVRIWHCLAAGAGIGLIGGGMGIANGLMTSFFFWVIAIWRNGEFQGADFANAA
jgi:hypothetical protein